MGIISAKCCSATARLSPNKAATERPRGVKWASRKPHLATLSGDIMGTISRRQAVSLALFSPLALVGSRTASEAYSAGRIDADVDATLREFSYRIGGARELVAKSAAVLVFPYVIKAGMG